MIAFKLHLFIITIFFYNNNNCKNYNTFILNRAVKCSIMRQNNGFFKRIYHIYILMLNLINFTTYLMNYLIISRNGG